MSRDDLDESLESHYVQPDGQGNLFGQFGRLSLVTNETVGVEGLRIFLVQNSKIVSTAETDEFGQFTLFDVPPGNYAICASGKTGFLAYGLHVTNPARGEGAGRTDFGQNILPGTSRQTPVSFVMNERRRPRDTVQINAAVVPPEFRAIRRVMSGHLPSNVSSAMGQGDDFELNVDNTLVADDFRVGLTPDNRLVGRMAPLTNRRDKPARLREMNAFLIQDDEIYARVPVNADGSFSFADVDPGVYAFAAAGEEGFAALSFQAVEAPELDSDMARLGGRDGFQFVSTMRPAAPSGLNVVLAPASETPFLLNQMEIIAGGGGGGGGQGLAGAFGAGGAGGAGGAAGGLGGVGALGGLAGLGGAGLAGGAGAGGTGAFGAPFGGGFGAAGFGDDGLGDDSGLGDGDGDGLGDAPVVPEPASMVVWGLAGALALMIVYWRRRRRAELHPSSQ